MNDIEKEGNFVNGDGQSIEFQAFRRGSPNGDEVRALNCDYSTFIDLHYCTL